MPIASFQLLKQLISSLSQSEKRHLVVYSKRMVSSRSAAYMKLFHLVEKNPHLSERQVRTKLGSENAQSFLNAKRHLYGQILKSVAIKKEDNDPEMILRQKLNFAHILYDRGELEACNRILQNTENYFEDNYQSNVALEILELQKKIESRHITRSRRKGEKVEWLIDKSKKLSQNVYLESQMLNVSLQVHGLYIKWGFVKNEKDLDISETYFKSIIPQHPLDGLSGRAKVLWHQCHVWYYYMRLEFSDSLKSGMRWIEIMEGQSRMIEQDASLYIRGLHYVLTLCYYLEDQQKYEIYYRKLTKFTAEGATKLNPASSILSLIYMTNASINYRLLRRKFSKLDEFSTEVIGAYDSSDKMMDSHRRIMLIYKIAMLYTCKGAYSSALDYVNEVLEVKEEPLRKDIYCYARLLQLYCHYATGNFDLVNNLLGNVRSAFESAECYNQTIGVMLNFLKLGSRAMNFGMAGLVDETLESLELLKLSRFDKVAFLYFDHFRWVKSIGMNTTMEKVA